MTDYSKDSFFSILRRDLAQSTVVDVAILGGADTPAYGPPITCFAQIHNVKVEPARGEHHVPMCPPRTSQHEFWLS